MVCLRGKAATGESCEEFFQSFFRRKDENEEGRSGSDELLLWEHTKNISDWKEVFDVHFKDLMVLHTSTDHEDEGLILVYNKWPQYPSDFREAYEEYAKHAVKLAFKLLELVSLSLGLPSERFHD
ncbi:unnamed protein product [Arabis nemorensis]|uniref:Uncharacterized protein n=1 Tax=Arabis nemorensis TaxID=586526 RepID=A0A565BA00_9BRAS|nr:unnamed protein product [Arabis nemorensis]